MPTLTIIIGVVAAVNYNICKKVAAIIPAEKGKVHITREANHDGEVQAVRYKRIITTVN